MYVEKSPAVLQSDRQWHGSGLHRTQ